jgi:serine/threonine protein kinase
LDPVGEWHRTHEAGIVFDALAQVGSGTNPTDWLIEYDKLTLGPMVGEGTSSQVFRGLYSGTGVAIKRLFSYRWDASEMAIFFRQEAALLARLHHPNVVRFYGVSYESASGHFFIITEFCPYNLQHLLQAGLRDRKHKASIASSGGSQHAMMQSPSSLQSSGGLVTEVRRRFFDTSANEDHTNKSKTESPATTKEAHVLFVDDDVINAIRISLAVCSGMCYLHGKNIVHRDLKPENVLLDSRGDVKLW